MKRQTQGPWGPLCGDGRVEAINAKQHLQAHLVSQKAR